MVTTNASNLGPFNPNLNISSARPIGCTCQLVDVTTIGSSQNQLLPVRDPACPQHGDHLLPDAPVAVCVVCGHEAPIVQSSWEEHDPRKVGWWCQDCRRAHGFG